MIRMPIVAGQFYNGNKKGLEHQIKHLMPEGRVKEKVLGALCPHAGFMYSGAVAGEVYSYIKAPETFILLGPNHTGYGEQFAIMSKGKWEIPTAVFDIDESLSFAIMKNSWLFKEDSLAHMNEHSLEVQLPFIANYAANSKIIPITMMHASIKQCMEAGEAIAKAIKESGKEVVIIASSDMSHYISDKRARERDSLVEDRLLSLDPVGMYDIVLKEKITMCGYIPSTVMLYAVIALGATRVTKVQYTTSAEVSGDYSHVVGYLGVLVQ